MRPSLPHTHTQLCACWQHVLSQHCAQCPMAAHFLLGMKARAAEHTLHRGPSTHHLWTCTGLPSSTHHLASAPKRAYTVALCAVPICAPGEGVINCVCQLCPVGTISAGGLSVTCTPCATGSVSNVFGTACRE